MEKNTNIGTVSVETYLSPEGVREVSISDDGIRIFRGYVSEIGELLADRTASPDYLSAEYFDVKGPEADILPGESLTYRGAFALGVAAELLGLDFEESDGSGRDLRAISEILADLFAEGGGLIRESSGLGAFDAADVRALLRNGVVGLFDFSTAEGPAGPFYYYADGESDAPETVEPEGAFGSLVAEGADLALFDVSDAADLFTVVSESDAGGEYFEPVADGFRVGGDDYSRAAFYALAASGSLVIVETTEGGSGVLFPAADLAPEYASAEAARAFVSALRDFPAGAVPALPLPARIGVAEALSAALASAAVSDGPGVASEYADALGALADAGRLDGSDAPEIREASEDYAAYVEREAVAEAASLASLDDIPETLAAEREAASALRTALADPGAYSANAYADLLASYASAVDANAEPSGGGGGRDAFDAAEALTREAVYFYSESGGPAATDASADLRIAARAYFATAPGLTPGDPEADRSSLRGALETAAFDYVEPSADAVNPALPDALFAAAIAYAEAANADAAAAPADPDPDAPDFARNLRAEADAADRKGETAFADTLRAEADALDPGPAPAGRDHFTVDISTIPTLAETDAAAAERDAERAIDAAADARDAVRYARSEAEGAALRAGEAVAAEAAALRALADAERALAAADAAAEAGEAPAEPAAPLSLRDSDIGETYRILFEARAYSAAEVYVRFGDSFGFTFDAADARRLAAAILATADAADAEAAK